MSHLDTVTAAVRLVTAAESWIPAVFAGFIPAIGAGGVFWLLWRAVRSNPENDPPPEGAPAPGEVPAAAGAPSEAKKEGGPESPPS